MATDLGKVGIVMKGTWSSSAAYEVLDAVSYNNGLYIAKQAVPANTAPTNTTYWQQAISGFSISSISETKAVNPSPTTLSYIGLSVTIPANKAFAVYYSLTYSNNVPLDAAICTIDSGTPAARHIMARTYEGTGVSLAGRFNQQTTLYCWAKWDGTGINNAILQGWVEN